MPNNLQESLTQVTTPASAMLSKKTRKKIRAWAIFVKPALNPRIPKDERDLKERLGELVWDP